MLIGNQYADNKIYSGIKHYDHYPLTSEDIHEYYDTTAMKNSYIMNNLLGYGTLSSPKLSVTSTGVKLDSPLPIMIDGDVSLIMQDTDKDLISKGDIGSDDVLCIFGWYQSINVNNTLYSYGGLENINLENDLYKEDLKSQVSTRYQFRWIPYIISKSDYDSDTISIQVKDRDRDTGSALSTTSTYNSISKLNDTFIFSKSNTMNYVVSNLYLLPVAFISSSGDDISIDILPPLKVGGTSIVTSETMPTGIITEGTVWYNPTTREFKTYIEDIGEFIDSASKMAFLQYQSIYRIDSASFDQDVVVPVNINTFQEGDILRVIYEGLELAVNLQYTINYTDQTIKLLDFTTRVGDIIYFTVTRIVEATDITNITETFVRHMSTTGSSTIEAHVKLSDTLSNSSSSQGVAATPKLVNDTKTSLESEISTINTSISTLETAVSTINRLEDEDTEITYKLGIDNGLLYIEEV